MCPIVENPGLRGHARPDFPTVHYLIAWDREEHTFLGGLFVSFPEVTIPIVNENLIAIFEKYDYNPRANEQVLNRYIKNILKKLSETVPSLKEKVPTQLTMKQKEAMKRDKIEPETDLNGNVIVPRYNCVTTHTVRRSGITNMYLTHKYRTSRTQ